MTSVFSFCILVAERREILSSARSGNALGLAPRLRAGLPLLAQARAHPASSAELPPGRARARSGREHRHDPKQK